MQGAAINPASGVLWAVEHGPKGGDELNIIGPGKNYGWPVITYGREYNGDPVGAGITAKNGMEQPVYYWNPDVRGRDMAPSGTAFYTGKLFREWKGSIFIGSLVGRNLTRLVIKANHIVGEEHLLADLHQRIRDVRQGPDGALYVLTDPRSPPRVPYDKDQSDFLSDAGDNAGELIRLVPAQASAR
jgi:glucose/arabinose dehydrogenase